MIHYVNENKPDHILTIEDPIEFVHESKRSLINQREVNRDTLGFSEALRSALREDPDVILVGEMRGSGDHSSGIDRSRAGHLVFGTLHTSLLPKPLTVSSMYFRHRRKRWSGRCFLNHCGL